MVEPIDQFIKAATDHGRHTLGGDSRNTNAAYRKLSAASDTLRLEADQGEAAFAVLLDHPDPSVRTWAALYLLPMRPKLALSVMDEVAGGSGLVAFDARVTAEEWRAGRLKIP